MCMDPSPGVICAAGLTTTLRQEAAAPVRQGEAAPPQDEELEPHLFNSRTAYEPGDDRDIWCKDCEYHRDHNVHKVPHAEACRIRMGRGNFSCECHAANGTAGCTYSCCKSRATFDSPDNAVRVVPLPPVASGEAASAPLNVYQREGFTEILGVWRAERETDEWLFRQLQTLFTLTEIESGEAACAKVYLVECEHHDNPDWVDSSSGRIYREIKNLVPAASAERLRELVEKWRALANRTRPPFTATNNIREVGMAERATGIAFCADELDAALRGAALDDSKVK